MNILINLSNYFISCAVKESLEKSNKKSDKYNIKINNSSNFNPDILLLDSNSLNQDMVSKYPHSKIILIDMGFKREKLVAEVIYYKVSGVISTKTTPFHLKKALRTVCEGQLWLNNDMIKTLLYKNDITQKGRLESITPREKEVLKLVCEGLSNKEIASRLSLSEQTVKSHLSNLFKKFDVKSRAHLMSIAINT